MSIEPCFNLKWNWLSIAFCGFMFLIYHDLSRLPHFCCAVLMLICLVEMLFEECSPNDYTNQWYKTVTNNYFGETDKTKPKKPKGCFCTVLIVHWHFMNFLSVSLELQFDCSKTFFHFSVRTKMPKSFSSLLFAFLLSKCSVMTQDYPRVKAELPCVRPWLTAALI